MGRTLLLSHRLPFSASIKDQSVKLESSPGGLATGLTPLLEKDNKWFGWNGVSEAITPQMEGEINAAFAAHNCVPISFPADLHHRFLTDLCNGLLWPLYHYQIGNLPVEFSGWDDYVRINRIAADRVAEEAKPGDVVWIHDYHFQLVPEMLRARNLDIKIGFFLHIPFPAFEVFRILPWRKEILKGLLGADLIGFHTKEYQEHFLNCAKTLLNIEQQGDGILQLVDRTVQVDNFPLGVDASELTKEYTGDTTLAEALHKVRSEHPELKIMLSVDRLDYTKGLARKILAFEYLLDKNPELREKIMLIQIAPPSRGDVPAYHHFRRQLDEHVGRINGKYGTPAYQPIFYVTRSFHPLEIYQIYKDVDVMLVTPVRDGMNLVAKEFVVSRDDGDGVLVLSEFAGAAAEMHEALMVNPYDIVQVASRIKIAVKMPREERRARMANLRDRVLGFKTTEWADNFIARVRAVPTQLMKHTFASPSVLAGEIAARHQPLVIMLDYDGTLFPIVRVPATAIPDQDLRTILSALAKRCELHIVSGRSLQELKGWFAGLSIHLHAEHGAISDGQSPRIEAAEVALLEDVAKEWQSIVTRFPGARIERKAFSLCLHYRELDHIVGRMVRDEAREVVTAHYPNLQVMDGKKVVEARFSHLNKGIVIRELIEKKEPSCFIAIGDDTTDEDMFGAIPSSGYTIVVGAHPSKASYRLRDSEDVRTLLKQLGKQLKERMKPKRAGAVAGEVRQPRLHNLTHEFLSV